MSQGFIDAPPQGQNLLDALSKQLIKGTKPLRNEILAQTLEALTTGGVGARIPLVQQAVEQSKAATSNAVAGVDARMGSVGLDGTPYGERIRAGVKTEGDLNTNEIWTRIIGSIIGAAPAITAGFTQQGAGAAQAAGEMQLGRQRYNADNWVKLMQDIKDSAQSLGSYGASAGGGGGGGGATPSTYYAAGGSNGSMTMIPEGYYTQGY